MAATPVASPRAHLVRDAVAGAASLTLVLAALVAFSRVFLGTEWVPDAALAVLLAGAIAMAAHALRFGPIASVVASASVLAVFTYVVHLPAGPLLPGAEQWAEFRELLGAGATQLRDEPAPTLPLDGIMVVVTSAAWGVTHVVHELTVRLRRPGLATVVALVLWAAPLSVPLPAGRTWPHTLPFLIAAALLLLLESDADVSSAVRDRVGPRLPIAGVAVGLLAAVSAAFVPGLLPGYNATAWADLGGGEDPRGYQPIVDVGDRLQLPDPRDVLEYQASRRTYLRLAALDTFDGTTWRLGPPNVATFRPDPDELTRGNDRFPPETEFPGGIELDVDVTILDLANIYVPVPYQPVTIRGGAADRMVYSKVGGFVATASTTSSEINGRLVTGVVEGLRYEVEAIVPSPEIDTLRAINPAPADVADWLELPGDYRAYGQLAEAIYRETGAVTNVDKAFALQDFFVGPDSDFVYTTDVSTLRGSGALADFLFTTRAGYCEYFSTSMAVMLRASGVPARVSVGFVGGSKVANGLNGAGDTYRVSTADAHAWVEVLFPGQGWIRFEPTPRADGAVQVPSAGDLDPTLTESERELGLEPSEEPTDAPEPTEPDAGTSAEPGDLEDVGGGAVTGTTRRSPLLPVGLGLIVLAAGGLVLASRSRRHVATTGPAGARVLTVQRRLLRRAASLGVGRRAGETTPTVLTRWSEEHRVERTAATRLGELTRAAAFGGDVTDAHADEADRLTELLMAELAASVEPRDRLLAPVRLPAEQAGTLIRDVREKASRPPVMR